MTAIHSRYAIEEARGQYRAFSLRFIVLALAGILVSGSAFASAGGAGSCTETATSIFGTTSGTGVNPICQVFNWTSELLTQNTGKALASLGISILGIMALFGKLRWSHALMTSFGKGMLFGAGSFFATAGNSDTNITLPLTMEGSAVADIVAPDPITSTFIFINQIMGSNMGRAVGVLAASIIGIAAVYGRLNWTQTFLWMTGLALMFGAEHFINVLWGPDTDEYIALYTTGIISPTYGAPDSVAAPFMGAIQFIVAPGQMGSMIATVAVAALGVMAAFGKVSWTRALLLIAGIALVYGSADVVYILSGPSAPCTQKSSDPFTQVICGFQDELMGPMGRVIGTISVMVLGILSMMGKISWDLGLTLTVGIALVFGAFTMVNMFEYASEALNLNDIDVVTCLTAAPTPSSTGNAIADVLCYIINILYGPAGKALACIAVVMMGFGAMLGKVSYSQAFIVAVGIAVTFGAPGIVKILLPSANTTGCTIQSHGGSATALAGAC